MFQASPCARAWPISISEQTLNGKLCVTRVVGCCTNAGDSGGTVSVQKVELVSSLKFARRNEGSSHGKE